VGWRGVAPARLHLLPGSEAVRASGLAQLLVDGGGLSSDLSESTTNGPGGRVRLDDDLESADLACPVGAPDREESVCHLSDGNARLPHRPYYVVLSRCGGRTRRVDEDTWQRFRRESAGSWPLHLWPLARAGADNDCHFAIPGIDLGRRSLRSARGG
jgi:hypothetical protein